MEFKKLPFILRLRILGMDKMYDKMYDNKVWSGVRNNKAVIYNGIQSFIIDDSIYSPYLGDKQRGI